MWVWGVLGNADGERVDSAWGISKSDDHGGTFWMQLQDVWTLSEPSGPSIIHTLTNLRRIEITQPLILDHSGINLEIMESNWKTLNYL